MPHHVNITPVQSVADIDRADAFLVSTFGEQLGSRRAGFWRSRFPEDAGLMQIALDSDGEVRGAAMAFADHARHVTLGAIAVDDAVRGQRVGSALLSAVEATARRRGAVRISLGSVDESVGFYLTSGYDAVLLVQFVKADVPVEDRIRMLVHGPLAGYAYRRGSFNGSPQLYVQVPHVDFELKRAVEATSSGVYAQFLMGKDL